MKVCLAQIKPKKGALEVNISNHIKWIEKAITLQSDLIVFSELSLTGFEPELAKKLALEVDDPSLDKFQHLSNQGNIAIGLGIPLKSKSGISISMCIFQPNLPRIIYSKQMLHKDELPYFVSGSKQVVLGIGNHKIIPAICYESLQPEHMAHGKKLGGNIYLTSVAKSQNGVEKGYQYYSKAAKKHSIPILMVNCVGYCDNFLSVGQSAVWNEHGELIGKLDDVHEGVLIYDTETNQASVHTS